MNAWLQNLSRRERLLVGVMVVLVAVTLVSLVVIRPLMKYRADGQVALQSAQTTSLLVSQAVAGAGGENAQTPVTGAALRGIVTSYAGQYNIPVTAFQLDQSGASVIISIENIAGNRLFSWLGRLEEERNIRVTEARISPARSGETNVQARLTLTQAN